MLQYGITSEYQNLKPIIWTQPSPTNSDLFELQYRPFSMGFLPTFNAQCCWNLAQLCLTYAKPSTKPGFALGGAKNEMKRSPDRILQMTQI